MGGGTSAGGGGGGGGGGDIPLSVSIPESVICHCKWMRHFCRHNGEPFLSACGGHVLRV